jgi:ABC-type thiamin/hydroxymethylpyrimidine transport system permease subunit
MLILSKIFKKTAAIFCSKALVQLLVFDIWIPGGVCSGTQVPKEDARLFSHLIFACWCVNISSMSDLLQFDHKFDPDIYI